MTPNQTIQILSPTWPAPASVKSVITTRRGGVSQTPFDSTNLALHVGDCATAVQHNRESLAQQLKLSRWQWLNQVHGVEIYHFENSGADKVATADGIYCDSPGVACAVLTADCLPVFLCSRHGDEVAVLHCGWRGLCGGILAAGVASFRAPACDLLAYLGPGIGPQHFEVGREVREAYGQSLAELAGAVSDGQLDLCFPPSSIVGKYMADIYAMARGHLRCLGVPNVYGGQDCTFADSEQFYSFRRDSVTGRFASVIWLSQEPSC